MKGAKVKVISIEGSPSKLCPSCKRVLPLTSFAIDKSKSDNRTAHCKNCRNLARARRRSLGFKEKSWHHPKQLAAANLIREMLRKGLISRPELCEVCGNLCKPEAHHRDYDKPYEVVWLCKGCHSFIHSQAWTRWRIR